MRLIDADEFFKDFTELEPYEHISHEYDIDAVEVVHGEWIMFERPNGGYYKGCSLCTYPMPTDMPLDYLCEEDNRFCYNCGAKMDGDVKHE